MSADAGPTADAGDAPGGPTDAEELARAETARGRVVGVVAADLERAGNRLDVTAAKFKRGDTGMAELAAAAADAETAVAALRRVTDDAETFGDTDETE